MSEGRTPTSRRTLEFSALEQGVCAFCGSECENAALVDEIHRAIERLVEVAPEPPFFNANTPDYVAALEKVRSFIGG